MKLIELIKDILEKSKFPLQQKEIYEAALQHPDYEECEELKRVAVPISAIARALSKNSTGTNPLIGILSEGKDKVSFKRFLFKE